MLFVMMYLSGCNQERRCVNSLMDLIVLEFRTLGKNFEENGQERMGGSVSEKTELMYAKSLVLNSGCSTR